MATREVLSPSQRVQLFQLPGNLIERDLARYYTLSQSDLDFIFAHRRSYNRLGLAVQLCLLRFPGQGLILSRPVPETVLLYLAKQVQSQVHDFQIYLNAREATRSAHYQEILARYQFRLLYEDLTVKEELTTWLFPHALGTDDGFVLVSLLLEEMRTRRVVVPGVSTVEGLVWEISRKAQLKIFRNINKDLSVEQQNKIDKITAPREGKSTYLNWLRNVPQYPCPENVLEIIERLEFVRGIGLDSALKKKVHAGRFRQLARQGGRYSAQHLHRFDPRRRYATLVAFLIETAEDLTDAGLEMHDRIMGGFFNKGERKHEKEFHRSGKEINEKVRLYCQIGRELIQTKENKGDFVQAITRVLPGINLLNQWKMPKS